MTIAVFLEKLLRPNKTRANFAETFEELIESYHAGSRNIEELYKELVKSSRNLSEEQQRHICENMSEEGLVIFDTLTRRAPELSTAARAERKKVARGLLNRLKQLLVPNQRQKSAKRSQLKLAIEDVPITPRASCFCLPRRRSIACSTARKFGSAMPGQAWGKPPIYFLNLAARLPHYVPPPNFTCNGGKGGVRFRPDCARFRRASLLVCDRAGDVDPVAAEDCRSVHSRKDCRPSPRALVDHKCCLQKHQISSRNLKPHNKPLPYEK